MRAIWTPDGVGVSGYVIGDSSTGRGELPRKVISSFVPSFAQAVQREDVLGGLYPFNKCRKNVRPTFVLTVQHEYASADQCAAAAVDVGTLLSGDGTLLMTFDGGVQRTFTGCYASISFGEVLAVRFEMAITFSLNPTA